MYKTRLQELCHQRMWPAPDYTVSREGPDHNPRFGASVTVNGVNFHAPDLSKSSKEAHNKAAQVAVDHLTAAIPPKHSVQSTETQISCKNQLCIYAQRNNMDIPKYDAVREGFAHAPRFKANVTIDGKTFSSPQFFSTLKEAENDAARVAASSLSIDENLQDEPNLYKNLLQEMATKEGICLPKYRTASKGACHMPVFYSTVEVGGDSFVGDDAKTKKQAEMNAAKVAWFKLKERSNANSGRASASSQCIVSASSGGQSTAIRDLEMPKPLSVPSSYAKEKHNINYSGVDVISGRASLSSTCLVHKHIEPASVGSHLLDIKNLELPKPTSTHVSYATLKNSPGNSSEDKKQEDEIIVNNDSAMVAMIKDYQDPHLSKETIVYVDGHTKKMAASHHEMDVVDVTTGKEVTEEDTIYQDGTSTPSSLSEFSDHPIADAISETPIGRASSSLLCNRVRVYPRTPNMVLPEGSILLPFSDDTWVAVSLDFTNYEDIYQRNGRAIESDSDNFSVDHILHDVDDVDACKENEKVVENASSEIMLNGNEHTDKLDLSLHELGIEVIQENLSDEGSPSSKGSAFNASIGVDVSFESPMGRVACSHIPRRVRVYPNRPDIVLPEGASLLPISDDKWIAVSLDV